MFKKILIANRGEIAVRIVRTCRDMGIAAVALYEPADIGSLHVRLADECVPLRSADGFLDGAEILRIAQETAVDAIHPGYGFLAEQPEFAAACEAAGVVFIGPSSTAMERVRGKLVALETARAAGFRTIENSPVSFAANDIDALREAANELAYPLVIKSCRGGRGSGERLVQSPTRLEEALRRSLTESRAVFGSGRVYLEKAILPAHQIGVQILADKQGNVIHLGEREGSLIYSNQKIVEESPAPCLSETQRIDIREAAVSLARLFQYENAGTVEFLVNGDGSFYFTEIKARIQVEHTVTEMLTGIDIVQQQIRIAAGETLDWTQDQVQLRGWGMMCRVHAEDPWHHFMPSPGLLQKVRQPGGPCVRVDTYAYSGCTVPAQYAPLFAKVTTVAADRPSCIRRMRRALEDFVVIGTPTNLPLLQRVFQTPVFLAGEYDTAFMSHPFMETHEDGHLQDLAVAAAVYFARRNQLFSPTVPDRFRTRWHGDSRRLPQ